MGNKVEFSKNNILSLFISFLLVFILFPQSAYAYIQESQPQTDSISSNEDTDSSSQSHNTPNSNADSTDNNTVDNDSLQQNSSQSSSTTQVTNVTNSTRENTGDNDSSELLADSTESANPTSENMLLVGRGHVQDYGWVDSVSTENSILIGTTGKNKRLEAITLSLNDPDSSSIQYSVHVQDYGWIDSVSNGNIAGTTGKSKRIEAIKISLSGKVAENYNVFYRAHVQDYGWLDWTSNGKPAGTQGLEKRMESLEVAILPIGTTPSDYDSPNNSFVYSTMSASAHIQYDGSSSTDMISNEPSVTLGKPDSGKRIEGISIKLKDAIPGSISYSTHIQDYGWLDEVSNGEYSGTQGKEKRLEAFQISLSDDVDSNFDLYYRAYVQDYGWLGWAKSGEIAGSEEMGKRIEAIQISLLPEDTLPNDYNSNTSPIIKAAISTSAHVQDYGWIANGSDSLSGNIILGTTGKSKRLEAVSLKLGDMIDGSISYSAHIQNIGWGSTQYDGAIAGTTGKSLRLEAIKINLNGNAANQYDIYYRAHVPNIGWLNWAKNGEPAGTEGCSIPIEAIEITFIEKNGTPPSGEGVPFLENSNLPTTISYGALAEGSWINATSGETAGTTGQSKALTGIRASITDSKIAGGITYSAHVANAGWLNTVADGTISQNGGNKVQALQMKLTGDLARYYDIYYRAHVANYGWMGWAKNGAYSGTTGLNKNLEAFQVVLVAKGAPAPGSTINSFSDENGFLGVLAKYRPYINKAQGYSSNTNYLILVDRGNHKVVVFKGSRNNWSLQYYWSCVTGAPGSPTITGTFSTTGLTRPHLTTDSRAIYCTQIWGGYFFHSILASESELGKSLSHGCIRLAYPNANWIYNNIRAGTTVVIYN